MDEATPDKPVILFDGICNLCNTSVNFVIDRDPTALFYFAPLQSEYGLGLKKAHGLSPAIDSIVLFENGRIYDRSTAALRIARHLNGPWSLLYGLIVVPMPLRDIAYRWVARNRYRWFGKREECPVPDPKDSDRFL